MFIYVEFGFNESMINRLDSFVESESSTNICNSAGNAEDYDCHQTKSQPWSVRQIERGVSAREEAPWLEHPGLCRARCSERTLVLCILAAAQEDWVGVYSKHDTRLGF